MILTFLLDQDPRAVDSNLLLSWLSLTSYLSGVAPLPLRISIQGKDALLIVSSHL